MIRYFRRLGLILLLLGYAIALLGQKGNDYFVFHGAAEDLGGSCTELVIQGKHYLVDIGLFYGLEELQGEDSEGNCATKQKLYARHASFDFDIKSIEAVFVTHAHMDHLGRLLYLYDKGFHGPVYCTQATKDLAEVMLLNSVRYDEKPRKFYYSKSAAGEPSDYFTVHWEEGCTYGSKIKRREVFSGSLCQLQSQIDASRKKDVNPCRRCAEKQCDELMKLFRGINFNEVLKINLNLSVTFIPTGHIPGSAAVIFDARGQGFRGRMIFSGDVGNDIELLYPKPLPLLKADYVVMEGTYGDLQRERNYNAQREAFMRDVGQALRDRDIVWIPSFALDRTQKILHELKLGQQKGLIPDNVSIYVPSPTARNITELYAQWLTAGSRVGVLNFSTDARNVFPQYIPKLPETKGEIKGPAILLTTSGMMDAAYSARLLPELLPREDVLLLFVGYQNPALPGGKILNGEQKITFQGQTIPVRLKWKKYDYFSGHGDFKDILSLLSENRDSHLFLNNGDARRLGLMQQKMNQQGFRDVQIAKPGVKYYLQ